RRSFVLVRLQRRHRRRRYSFPLTIRQISKVSSTWLVRQYLHVFTVPSSPRPIPGKQRTPAVYFEEETAGVQVFSRAKKKIPWPRVGARRFELPTFRSRTERSSQAELRPVHFCILVESPNLSIARQTRPAPQGFAVLPAARLLPCRFPPS